jgi:hypothetical protein
MAGTNSELEKYERAMKDILKQLDWCIDYLQGIQKTKAARALAQNRAFIAKQIGHENEGPTSQRDTM